MTYAHLWLQVFIFAKLSRCSYLSFSEMTREKTSRRKSLVSLSNLASLLVQMVVMDHLSESVPSLSKAAQETDQIPRLLLHYARHSGVHHNGNLRSGFAMTEARVSLDRVYNMFPQDGKSHFVEDGVF